MKAAGFALLDAKNAVVVSWPAEIPDGEGPILSAQVVAAGRYRLRAAAMDVAGSGAAADYEFDASLDTVGPLFTSSLMTGVLDGTAFRPRLVFTPGDDLVPYLELYGTAADVNVVFELVPAAGGAPVAAGPATSCDAHADRRLVNGMIPLGRVPAGDYVVRAAIRVGSGGRRRAQRTRQHRALTAVSTSASRCGARRRRDGARPHPDARVGSRPPQLQG